jgi:tetratricopeptide (TPR) repeat protein
VNLEVVGCGFLVALALAGFLLRRQRRTRGVEPERFNHSRWKEVLLKRTARKFRGTKWKLQPGRYIADREISFFLESALGNFELLCLDRTMKKFKSETDILESLEVTAGIFLRRKSCLVIIYDDGMSPEFVSNAERRSLLTIHVDELDALVGLEKYIDHVPDELPPPALRIMRKNFSVCMSMANRLKSAGRLEQAIEWARRAIDIRYGYSAHFTLFLWLIEKKDWDAAETIGNEGLSFRPKESIEFFKGFQKIAIARNNDEIAIEWAKRWIAAAPDDALAHDNLASLYEMQKNGPAAYQAVDKALQIAPKHSGILRRATKIALMEEKLSEALGYAERWAALEPKDGSAHEVRADILLRQKDYDGARAAIAMALILQPNSCGFIRRSSTIALESGDLNAATRFAEQWVAVAPTDPWAYDHLSIVHLRALRYEKARQANARALEFDPANPNFQRRTVDIQKRLGTTLVPTSSTST